MLFAPDGVLTKGTLSQILRFSSAKYNTRVAMLRISA